MNSFINIYIKFLHMLLDYVINSVYRLYAKEHYINKNMMKSSCCIIYYEVQNSGAVKTFLD